MDKIIFSLSVDGDLVEVVETETGSFLVNFYQLGKRLVTVHKYKLDSAMELARAFIDNDDEGLEQ